MYYKNFDEVWQDILKVAKQKKEIRTLAQQVSNCIVSTTDDSITVFYILCRILRTIWEQRECECQKNLS